MDSYYITNCNNSIKRLYRVRKLSFKHNVNILVCTKCVENRKINYLSYKLFKVHNTDNVLKFIENFNIYDLYGVDIMSVNKNFTNALVAPEAQIEVEKVLQQLHAPYTIDDKVQRFVI